MNKQILLLLIVLLASVYQSYAQPSFTTSDKDAAKAIKISKLAVVWKDKDEKVVKRLSKKTGALAAYEKSLTELNSMLKQAMEKHWQFSSEVTFISQAEAEALKEKRDPRHYLLEITEISNYKMGDFYSPNPNYQSNSARDMAYHLSSSGESIALAITHAAAPKKEIVISYLPAVGVSMGTVSFMVLNLQNQLSDCLDKGITRLSDLRKDISKRATTLPSKTLLIFDPLISKGLRKTIDKNEVEKHYSGKYKVVSFEEADALIAERAEAYCYIWVVPAGAVNNGRILFNYFIIDAADARPLFLTGSAVAGANGDFHQAHLMMANKSVK